MTRAIVLICPLFLMASVVRAQDADSTPAAVLALVEESLRTVLADISPKPTYEHHSSGSLTVKYKARQFMLHGSSKTGQFSEKAKETVGPSYLGFVLNIHLQGAGLVNQAGVPQTVKLPYWQTELDVTKIRDSDFQVYWALSYGNRPDQATLKEIRKAIHAFRPSKRKGSKGATSKSGTTSDRPLDPAKRFPLGATRR